MICTFPKSPLKEDKTRFCFDVIQHDYIDHPVTLKTRVMFVDFGHHATILAAKLYI